MNYRRYSHRRYSRYRSHPLNYEPSTFLASASPCSSNYLRCTARPYTPLPRIIGTYSTSHTRCRPCKPCTSRRSRYNPGYVPLIHSNESLKTPKQRRASHIITQRRDSHTLTERKDYSQRNADADNFQKKANAFLEDSNITLTSRNSYRSGGGNSYQSGGGNSYRSDRSNGGMCKSCSSGDRYSSYRSSAGSFTPSKSSSRYSRHNSNMEDVTEESKQSIDKYSSHGTDTSGCYNRSKSNMNTKEDGDNREKIKHKSRRHYNNRDSMDGIVPYDVDGNHQDEDKETISQDQSNECRNQISLGDTRQSRGSFGDNRNVNKEISNKNGHDIRKNNRMAERQQEEAPSENCKATRNGPRRKISKKPGKGKSNEAPIGQRKRIVRSKQPPKENKSQTKTNNNNRQSKLRMISNNNMDTENVNLTALPMVQVNNENTAWQPTTDSYETTTTFGSERSRNDNRENTISSDNARKIQGRNDNTRNDNKDNTNTESVANQVNGAPSNTRNEKRNHNDNMQQGSKELCQESTNVKLVGNPGKNAGNKQEQKGKGENPDDEDLELEITAEDIPDTQDNENTDNLNMKDQGHRCQCDGYSGEMKSRQSKRRLPKELDFDTYFETTFAEHLYPNRSCKGQCKHKAKISSARSLKEPTRSRMSIKRPQRSPPRPCTRHCTRTSVYNFNLHDLVTKDHRFVTPREKIMTKYLLSSSESLPEVMKTKNKKTDYYMNKFEREWHHEMEILKSARHSSRTKYQNLGYW
ncbi:hypothetical protein WDU94_005884 [Cyamophila willieti]